MEGPNVVKVDSKGRILIPSQFRTGLGVEEGTEMIIVPDLDKNEFRVLPISKDATVELRVLMGDMPSSIASVFEALSANSFKVLLSESRRTGSDMAEMRLVLDTANNGNSMETLRDVVSSVPGVKTLDFVRD